MNTIIEKIRAEIERRKKELEKDKTIHPANQAGRIKELDLILSVLSDLEKEEKPTNIDFEQELYNHFGQVKDFTLGMMIGQYFYNLGRQSKSNPERKLRKVSTWVSDTERELKEKSENPTTQKQPVCEGLEKEMEKFIETFGWGKTKHLAEKELISTTARHFAQWGAEHRGLSEILKDLEEAAEEYSKERAEGHILYDWVHAFIAGAKWQKEKDNEVADKALTTSIKLQEGWYAKGIADGEKSMKEQMMKEAVEKKGVVWDDEFVKFDDGTFLDFRDPTLGIKPAFVLPKNGEKVKVIVIKEEEK